jgi:hypothetical protein
MDRSYHFDAKMIKPMRVKSYENISNQDIEASMKELRKHPLYHTLHLSCDPEFLRIIRQYGFTEDW